MRKVFPNIGNIDMQISYEGALVPNTLQQTNFAFVTTRIRLIDAPEDREDLAFDLADCGSGVGQVLSMLYVLHSATQPKTIIIDEPNSFLHPGAARKLMEVFQDFPQHQYIITTHSTETISSIREASLHLVKWQKGESTVETQSSQSYEGYRRILAELDVKLSDVFAADQIVWVEGPTERECFPRILKHNNIEIPTGCRFIPVVSTADLSRNSIKAQVLVDIYRSICCSNAILPPIVAISLDRESLSDEQIAAMQARFQGKVHFLERRCVENYMIRIEAITSVLIEDGFSAEPSETMRRVGEWLNQNGGHISYKAKLEWDGNIENAQWLKKVDGAKLLSSLFTDITDSKHVFPKNKAHP